jgi:rubredoxin
MVHGAQVVDHAAAPVARPGARAVRADSTASRPRAGGRGWTGIRPLFGSQAMMRRPQYLIEFVEEFRRMTTATAQATRTWMCLICGWIYDEAAGLPDEGIAPGTRWEDLPPNWTCPECGARKEDFEMVEI